MTNHLNPGLFQALSRAFGDVRVSNQGVAATISRGPVWINGMPRLREKVISWGETYSVDCPMCVDFRKRLRFAHLWGVNDPKTADNRLHLAMCFNESCLKTREKQEELQGIVVTRAGRVPRRRPKAQAGVGIALPAITWPKGIPVDQLPLEHPVNMYLAGRGFDPRALGRERGLCYVEGDLDSRPAIREPRLLIPIHSPFIEDAIQSFSTLPEGWQARLIGDCPGAPKYLSAAGMAKSRLLYGLDLAFNTKDPFVVVEGVADVWKVGPGAVALLGKTVSARQAELVLNHAVARPVVVLLDADARAEALAVRDAILRQRATVNDDWPVLVGSLSPGRKDPGECTSQELRDLVASLVAAHPRDQEPTARS